MKTHKDLKAWQNAMELAKLVNVYIKPLPGYEIHGLAYQIRKCIVSVPSNIAEGAARKSKKEYIQFCYIALGSLSELETQLLLCNDMYSLRKPDEIFSKMRQINKQLKGLINYLYSKR